MDDACPLLAERGTVAPVAVPAPLGGLRRTLVLVCHSIPPAARAFGPSFRFTPARRRAQTEPVFFFSYDVPGIKFLTTFLRSGPQGPKREAARTPEIARGIAEYDFGGNGGDMTTRRELLFGVLISFSTALALGARSGKAGALEVTYYYLPG